MYKTYFTLFLISVALAIAGCKREPVNVASTLAGSKWTLKAVVNSINGDLQYAKKANSATLDFTENNNVAIVTPGVKTSARFFFNEKNSAVHISAIKKTAPSNSLTKTILSTDSYEFTGSSLQLTNSKTGVFVILERTK